MNILQDQWKPIFAAIAFARFADGACDRVGPHSFVVGSAIVITRKAKTARRPEYQKSGRKRQPRRYPRRFWPKPRVRRISKDLGRIKRRNIAGAGNRIMIALKRGPCRIDDKSSKANKRQERLNPPAVLAHGLTKRASLNRNQI